MNDDAPSSLRQRIDDFDLSELHSKDEWQSFFSDAIALLDHPDQRDKEYGLDRLQKALWAENMQSYRQAGFRPMAAASRLLPILEAIGTQSDHCLLRFLMWTSLSDEQKVVLTEWLDSSMMRGAIARNTFEIAKIQAKILDVRDWNEVKTQFEAYFNHPDDLLRAAAAAAFGEMYSDDALNLPPLSGMMWQVKNWEIERPGFAGAFLGQLLNGSDAQELIGDTLNDWILEIIAKRNGAEPEVPFYNGIDFYAHEILSNNPEAVRKLIEFGAESVAAMAATEENRPIAGMQELLEILGTSSDDFISRICSWQLAYYYRFLHEEGVRRGFVQLAERDDVDIFLAFSPGEHQERPYAATIYPKESVLEDTVALKWTDRLVPPDLRPSMEDNQFPYRAPQIGGNSAMYVYGAYIIDFFGDCDQKYGSVSGSNGLYRAPNGNFCMR